MSVTHTFVSAIPDSGDATLVQPSDWNAAHTIDITNADVNAAAAIAESKLALSFATHAAVTIGTANGLSLATQALSLGLASAGVTGALSGTDWSTFNAKQAALTLPLTAANGGTGIANGASASLTLPNAATTITGGGTIALGTFTLTVPATGTAALLATANVFTADQQLNTGKAVIFQDTSGTREISMGITYDSTGSSATYINFTPVTANQNAGFNVYPNGTGTFSQLILYGQNSGSNYSFMKVTKNKTGGVIFEQTAVGSGYSIGPYRMLTDTTVGNSVLEVMRIQSQVSTASTGGSNGFGTGFSFYSETATASTFQLQGYITTAWIDATNASRKAKMSLYAYDTASRLGIEIEASGTVVKLGFFGVATVVRPVALTTQLTTLTHTAPGTPDYALQDLIDSSAGAAFGFATKDEGNSVLKVVANLQTRLAEVETKLQALGLLT